MTVLKNSIFLSFRFHGLFGADCNSDYICSINYVKMQFEMEAFFFLSRLGRFFFLSEAILLFSCGKSNATIFTFKVNLNDISRCMPRYEYLKVISVQRYTAARWTASYLHTTSILIISMHKYSEIYSILLFGYTICVWMPCIYGIGNNIDLVLFAENMCYNQENVLHFSFINRREFAAIMYIMELVEKIKYLRF